MEQKRCLTIQDISCMGRCSLTVALPIISAAGIETVIIPTAVLSNHTAGFKSWTFRDMTEDMLPIVDKWKGYKTHFDAIYTGYLAASQIPVVSEIFDRLKDDKTLILVDPAMADSGKMYPGFDLAFAKKMAELVSKADITVPNLTEAAFMLGEEYHGNDYNRAYIASTARKLANLGPRYAVLSGVSFEKGKAGVFTYDKKEDRENYFCTEDIPGYFHGTGDIFASGLISGILNGMDITKAARLAHNLVHYAIQESVAANDKEVFYGVRFEPALGKFIADIQDLKKNAA